MIYLIITFLAFITTDPADIAIVNALKKEAKNAYLAGDFDKAIGNYHILLDSMGLNEDEISLNLAHAYARKGDTEQAKSSYNQLVSSDNKNVQSIANQQLGIYAKEAQELEKSLNFFKQSLMANPANEDARYNYEVVKKLLDEQQKKQDQQNQENQQDNQNKEEQNKDNKDQKKQDNQQKNNQDNKDNQEKQNQQQQEEQSEQEQNQENKEQQSRNKEDQQKEQEQQQSKEDKKEGEEDKQEQARQGAEKEEQNDEQKKPQPYNPAEALKEMKISPEKAKMILEAMRNHEVQYIQQQKRKQTKRWERDKPDW